MGAIAVSIFVTLVALIGVIYFKYQELNRSDLLQVSGAQIQHQ